MRLDLGAFAIAVPGAFQPNDDFDVSANGFGAKVQYFLFAEQRGGFAGIDANLAWNLAQRADTDLAARDRQVTLGGSRYEPMRTIIFPAVHIGCRFL